MSGQTEMLLESGRIARECACVLALVMITTRGDPEQTIRALEKMSELVPVTDENELDVASIAAQAVREARELRA